jgi:hypothetical protein
VRLAGFPLAFALILVLKWGSLAEPPFWDAAMGLFPAALTLSATGFDVLGLLASPGYEAGGPHVHATSPVTLATGLAYMLLGGGTSTLVVLRLLHFALAAWALAVFHRLVAPSLGPRVAALLCLAVLLHPTFSAQVGYLYLEVPLFLCAVLALDAWVRGRFWPAALWAALAWATKQTGGIVVAALATAALLERRPVREKARRLTMLIALPVLWTGGFALLGRLAVGPSSENEVVPSFDAVFGGFWQYTQRFLLNVPDLIAYLAIFSVAAVALAVPTFRALRREPVVPKARTAEQGELLVAGLTGLAVLFFLGFFLVALPPLGFTIVLPRYCVIVLPFLLLWTALAMKRTLGRLSPRAPAIALAILAAAFALNTNGVLYPIDIDTEGPGNDPPLTERSNAYKRLLGLQLEAMDALQELPRGVPIYYGHFEHYLLRYPDLGYARGPLANGHNLHMESLAPLATAQPFPDCVYALFNYPWLGGEKVLGLIRLAEVRPDVSAEIVREIRDGRYAILLVRVQRADATCPV